MKTCRLIDRLYKDGERKTHQTENNLETIR